jgi:signal transduction histidine kinase
VSAPTDYDHDLIAAGGAPALVIRNKAHILEVFCHRVQASLPGARASEHPVIIDTLPAFITRLAMAMSPAHRDIYASQYSNIALQHGNERARFTPYSLKEVIKEYQFLREILVSVLRSGEPPTPPQWDAMHRSIDEGMAEAAAAFIEVQDGLREMFTAALTHDFRGPLQTAMNFIEVLRRQLDLSQRDQFAARATNNLKRLDRMIVDLLDISRRNAGERMSLELSEHDVGVLVQDVLDDVAVRMGANLRLEIERPVRAFLNEERMRQALHNLVDNAAKYGRPDTEITVRVAESHGRVLLSVHNFGDAIPPHELHTLFTPYRRSREAARSGKAGWGLGLALVQAIAEAHGGSVGVESTAEDGTTFTIDVLLDPRDLEAGGAGRS